MIFRHEKSSDPFFIPAWVADWADRELARLPLASLQGAQLLTERAAISGYFSRGTISPGGSCRLLEASDGWMALNLARDEDWDLLPAWLEAEVARDWDAVAAAVRSRSARELAGRGREIGLALALDEIPVGAPLRRDRIPVARKTRSYSDRVPRVIDLSSLWAGPLCGHLLQQLGAEVVKVESVHRPDGARRGPALFFDLLNAGKASAALDFRAAEGRDELRSLIESADIVIEASRPRALRQLGIDAPAICARQPRLVWIGITAYGRSPATENWIGYGDDVAVAAGLTSTVHAETDERRIVGDAIADPLTGIHAAAEAWQAWSTGQGGLHDIAMFDVVRRCMEEGRTPISPVRGRTPIPRGVRNPSRISRALGADTVVQLREASARRRGQTPLASAGDRP